MYWEQMYTRRLDYIVNYSWQCQNGLTNAT